MNMYAQIGTMVFNWEFVIPSRSDSGRMVPFDKSPLNNMFVFKLDALKLQIPQIDTDFTPFRFWIWSVTGEKIS